MKKLITLFVMLAIAMIQTSSGQNKNKSDQQFGLIITSNPLLVYQKGLPNILAGLNWRWLELNVTGSFSASEGQIEGFKTQYQEYSIMPSVKFYPFNSFFNCLHRSIGHGKNIAPCFTFKEKKQITRPNGIYLMAGYVYKRMLYKYIPDAALGSPISEFPFAIKNNGVRAEVGYQITIRWFSLGLGYGFHLCFPKKEGSIDPFGDSIYTNKYPFKYKLERQVNLQIGINLKLKK